MGRRIYFRIKKNDELYHSGVIGMRWGIRRYQNEDGTLTPAGKIRYAKQQKKEKQEQEYEEALSIIDQQLKRIPWTTAAVSTLKCANPNIILANGFSAGVYKTVLAQEVAKLTLSRRVFVKQGTDEMKKS